MKLISGIVDSGFFAQSALSAEVATKDSLGRNISETYLTTVPEGYATENWVTSQGYLTGHQSLDGLMSASLLEQSGGLITGYNGSAFAGQGGGVTGDFELSAGSGISIVDYPLEQKTVISVTAQGGNPEVEQAVIDNSATWNDVTSKADITAIPSTAGLATTGDLQTVSADITALIPTALTGDYVTADVLSSYKLENSALTVSSVTPNEWQTNTGVAEYGIGGVYLASGYENQYNTGSYTELSLRPEGLSGYSGYSGYYFNINATGISGAQGSTALSYYLSPECVSGHNQSTAWRYGDKFTNAGFTVGQYGTGYFIAYPDINSGSENSVAIGAYGLTASGGSGNSGKTIVNPWDVQVTSYNGKKIYSLISIGESQPTTGNMSSYKYIEFPYKLGIFGHTANVREARKELDWFDVDAAFNNASQGIVSGNDWYNYINIPFIASSDAYDIRWNFTGGNDYSGFAAAVLTATADGNWTANSVASASFGGKSGFLNVTGLTENTTYYLYAFGAAPKYGVTAITPFTAEIGSAFWYDYTATSAGFIIPDEPVLTFKVIGE